MLTRLGSFLYRREGKLNRALVLLAMSLACGIAALVALETFSRRVQNTVNRDSKKVLAADFQVQSWRPFDDQVWQAVADEKSRGDTVLLNDFVSTLSFRLEGHEQTATVSARAIEGDAYPFYGDFIVEPSIGIKDLKTDAGIILDKSFQARGVKIGDSVQLGAQKFVVRSFLLEEPQAVMGAFSLGPRIIFSRQWLDATGLARVGSRVFQQLLIRSPLSSAEFEKKFRAKAPDLHWRITTPERASRQVERVLDRMRGFLSFVGIASLFLGAMGLFMVFRSQFLQKLPSYLTLRCLGAKNKSIVEGALLTSSRVALLGSGLGIAFGLGIEALLTYFARQKFSVDLGAVSWWPAIGWGLILSFLCVGVSVWLPLREVLRVPVSNAIREAEGGAARLSYRDAAIALVMAIFVVFLVGPQIKMSFVILAGIVIAVLLLLVAANLFLKFFRLLGQGFTLRHAHLQLIRKRGRTQLLVIAYGMSLFFLFLILFMGASIRQQLNLIDRKDIPNLFALNVSAENKEQLHQLLPEASFVPVTQARIVQLDGKEVVEGEVPEEGAERFYQTREYVITKRESLTTGEELVAGKALFGARETGVVRLSIEEQFSQRLKLKVGDRFQIDLAGARLNAVVSSIRKVNWFNFQPNFFMVFNPDDIAGAPMDFVALLRVPSDQIVNYQAKVAKAIPQVTLVDGEALASRLLKILGQLSLAVYSVTLFSLMGCFFVFVGIFLARRNEMIREVALWRCLGLRNGKILGIYTFESLFLGLLAAISSFVSSLLVVWIICRWVIDIPMELVAPQWILLLLAVPALVSALGIWILLQRTFNQSSQALFRQAEESY